MTNAALGAISQVILSPASESRRLLVQTVTTHDNKSTHKLKKNDDLNREVNNMKNKWLETTIVENLSLLSLPNQQNSERNNCT